PPLPQADLDARVAHRMERRKIFERDEPPTHKAIIHEAALRMRFGGRKVTSGQLEYLQEQCEHPNITVRVVPFESEGYVGASRAMLYAGGPVPKLDTVQVETALGAAFLDAQSHLDSYRTAFTAVEAAALSDADSRDFIHTIAQEA
ncbi:DUF5753 domain-containing protein, partial [Streptomyces milbemycinicus]